MSRTNSISAIDALSTFIDTLRDLGYTSAEVKKALVYFAQPLVEVQEPVTTWLNVGGQARARYFDLHGKQLSDDTKLYAAPVRGLPLTEIQVEEIALKDEFWGLGGNFNWKVFARAVEKAHGISSPAPGGDGEMK